MLAKFLHRQVALRLRKIAVERLRVVAVFDQSVGHFLRLQARAAKDNTVDLRIIVDDALQCVIFIARLHKIIRMVDVFSPFIARSDHDFFMVVQIIAGYALNLAAHRRGEKQRVSILRNACQDSIDAFRESHIQHLVRLVEHHVFHVLEFGHAALHQVDEAPRGRYDYLRAAFQRADLAFNTRTAVNSLHVQAVNVSRIVFQVIGNLQAEFSRRTQDHGLRSALRRIYLLQNRKPVSCRFACTGLC